MRADPELQVTGPHLQENSQAGIEWLRNCTIALICNDAGLLDFAQPGTFTGFRIVFNEYEQPRYLADPDALADRYIAALGGRKPSCVVGLNERYGYLEKWGGGLREHVACMRQFVKRMHAYGVAVAGYSFASGSPDEEDWRYLADQNFGDVDYIDQHGYNGLGGPSQSQWVARRIEIVRQWIGHDHPPFVAFEAGRDAIEQEGAKDLPGWKLQNVTAEQYLAEIKEQDRWIRTFPRNVFIGQTIFSFSRWWEEFDASPLVPMMRWEDGVPAIEIPSKPSGGGTMPQYEYILGFKEYAEKHPEIGKPTSPLMYDANGTAVQYTEKGMLHWNKASNQTLFFRASQ